MQVDFGRERRWWDAKAPREETDNADEAINRALRWRELERHLDGLHTVLDVGGGTGAFSIPLARRGFEVTHVDLSPAMLDIARQKAEGLSSIRFVEGNAVDLATFRDRAFDLVLNMDGAISFCGSEAERAILESCRVAKSKLIITVSHRARLAPIWVEGALATLGHLAPLVDAMFDQGAWHQEQFPENRLTARGCTQDYMGALKAFLPGELRMILGRAGMHVLRCGGLGSLAGFCGQETLDCVRQDEQLMEQFLDLCEHFDREILPHGPGTRQRAGLIAVAEGIAPSEG
jgi:SAM-dependent methyltransferase